MAHLCPFRGAAGADFPENSMSSLSPANPDVAEVLDHVPDGLMVLDGELRFTLVNRVAEHFLGQSRAALLGRNIWEVFPHAVGTRSHSEYERARSQGVEVMFDDFSARLGRWFEVQVSPAGGRLIIHFRDITERRVIDAQSRRCEARFRSLMQGTQQAVWVTAPDGAVREDIPGWRAFTGLPYEEITGFGWLSAIHPDDRAATAEAWSTAVATRGVFEAKQRLRRRDGVYRHMHVRAFPLFDASGAVVEWVGTSIDVTAQVEAEQQLRERDWLLAEALRLAQVGSGSWDVEHNVLRWSDEQLRIYGVTRGDEPKSFDAFLQLVHPEDRRLLTEGFGSVVHEKRVQFSKVFRIVRPDGAERLVHASGEAHFHDDGRPLRLIGAMQDITERERAAAAQRELETTMVKAQKMESLGILAGGIAHDVNNLLVGILGNASVALDEVAPRSPLAEALAEIVTTAQRTAELAHQLLAYSGKGRFAVAPLDVSTLVREQQFLLRTVVSRSAALRIEAPPDLPWIEADESQIRQVVMNLITNASDALGAKPGALTVRTGVVAATSALLRSTYVDDQLPEGDYVLIEVVDDGVGMTPATMARMFDPFFTTKQSGHGLGLAATLGIVRGHRGAIKVETDLGKGTRITALFPAMKGREQPAAPRAESESAAAGGTILVVDDDELVRRVAGRMLKRGGYSILEAEHGKAALALFEANRDTIALVLLDLSMPVMGGEETFTALRALAPRLPIVLSSGYNEHDATSHFVGRGLAGFVQKPFVMSDLLSVIRHTLRT